jgi:uncharacterized protein with HEPN domain
VSRSDEERFDDMLAAIERCQSYERFLGSRDLDAMAYDVILRNLAVIGEAVRALPAETREAMPDVPWAAICGLRNVVVADVEQAE